jgi:Tfp pilus assembly protein PilV
MAKLKASSLLEVIVAMTLFAIIFPLGITMYTKIVQSSFTSSELKASLLLAHLAEQTKKEEAFIDATMEEGVIRIERKIELYENNPALLVLVFKAYNQQDTLLAQRKELYLLRNE